jgi:hypothetical protein
MAIAVHDALPDRERSLQRVSSSYPQVLKTPAERRHESAARQGVEEARVLFGQWRPKPCPSPRDIDRAMLIMEKMTLVRRDDRDLLWLLARGRPLWKVARKRRTTATEIENRLHDILVHLLAQFAESHNNK